MHSTPQMLPFRRLRPLIILGYCLAVVGCGSDHPDITQPVRSIMLGTPDVSPSTAPQNSDVRVEITATASTGNIDSIVGTLGGLRQVASGGSYTRTFPVTATGTLRLAAYAEGAIPVSTSVTVPMQSASLTTTSLAADTLTLGDSIHVVATLAPLYTAADSIVAVTGATRTRQVGASFSSWLVPSTTGIDSIIVSGYAIGAVSPVDTLVVTVLPVRPPPAPGRLNIVLILTDDQRSNTMQYMPITMSLIGNQGVVFSNAFASTPLCCPSRASILTGLYTHNHHVITNFAPLGGAPAFTDTSTIGTWLQNAGYRTALVGKYLNDYDKLRPWPYKPPGWNVWQAFKLPEYFNYNMVEGTTEVHHGFAPGDYSTDVLTAKAIAFIQSTPDSQPLFLYFTPYGPHAPAIPAPQDAGSFNGLLPWRPPSYNEADVGDKPTWVQGLPSVSQAKSDSNDAFRQRQIESLQSEDRAVGQIIQAMADAGRLDSTAIIFASDNGLAWGEHRYFTKNCVYEECIRVPLMIRAPGIAPRMDSHLVELIDLAPTLAFWARLPAPPARVNGLNLGPLLANPGAIWRTEILLEVLGRVPPPAPEALFSAVRTDHYLYSELTTGEKELYDVQADPFEMNNLAGDPGMAGVIAQLKALLDPLKVQ
ncbi:MAG: sulfatase-like hydrolase/transferase [Gemmatimonadota bacterium]